MKKFSLIIALVIALSMMPTLAFAGTSLSSAHKTALTKLTDACGYYGWCTSEEEFSSSSTAKTTAFVGTILYNDTTYEANFKVKTVKAKKKKKVTYASTYYTGGKKYSLSSIKKMLKKYSSTTGKACTVKKSTIDISDELIELAQDYNWTVEVTARTEQTDKYAQTIKFRNGTYAWTAEVITERSGKSKKLVVSYNRDGIKSTRAYIEEWIKKYSV